MTRVTAQPRPFLAGTSLLGWPAGGLYWFAGAVVLAVIAGTGNAWVLLVEVVRDQRYRTIDEGGMR
jgi:hypothetical protein